MGAIINILLAAAALASALAVWALWRARRAMRRRRLMRAPLRPEWTRLLGQRVALYRRLPAPLRERLHGMINVFLAEKRFEGCGGLTVTDEMRVIVAAQASLLRLSHPDPLYPRLASILIYPHPYYTQSHRPMGKQIIAEVSQRAGESSPRGALVLAWDNVAFQADHPETGHNVVLHEFAHQLDQEDGVPDGAPLLDGPARYRSWSRVLSAEFAHLQQDVEEQRESVLDDYGATAPAEFFAVATETFFTRPLALRAAEPELYGQLRDYYDLDPAEWER